MLRFAKDDADRIERNKLKAAIDTYNDVWEEKKVKVGPVWVTKKVRKETVADKLRDNHLWEMGGSICICIYMYVYTHTHTHIYICIYVYV